MSSAAGFLQAILEAPDDDTPRLVYADWLDETGKPEDAARAELIRVQIEQVRCEYKSPRYEELKERVETLIATHGDTWLGPLLPLLPDYGTLSVRKYTFFRGMPYIWLSPGKLLQKAGCRLATEWLPKLGVQELRFRSSTKRVAALVGLPLLRDLHSLCWWDSHLGDAGLKELSRSPHLVNISSLTIDKPWATDAGLKHLAGAVSLNALRKLKLEGTLWKGRITAAGIQTILTSERLPRFDSLDLSQNTWGLYRFPSLAQLTGFRRLKRLNLAHNYIKGDGVRDLAANPNLANLVELNLGYNEIDDDGALALADSPHLAGLTKLVLLEEKILGKQVFSPETHQRLRDRFGAALVI
jgi:uncharacterized protein (TIGR02996 family)